MIPENLPMGIFFFSQTVIGLLGNWTLLFHYFTSVLTGKSLMPKDQILKHLTLANSLVIMSRGIPQTMAEFGLAYLLDDLICKFIIYSNRASRGISLYTTCLLSCFQAISISPSTSRWVKLKHRATKYMGLSCSLSWLMHFLLNSRIAARVTALGKSRNFTKEFNLGYCAGFGSDSIVTSLYLLLLCFMDGLYLSLMAWASVSMVNILYKHKKRICYLHSIQYSPKVSHESRAIQAILILVCTFVTFYSTSFFLVLYTAVFDNQRLWLISMFTFLDTCFPTFCPFILIGNSNSLSKFHCPYGRKI